MSFWKRSMEYLGLGPDDAYDDYDDGPEPEPPGRQRQRDDHGRSNSKSWPAEPDSGAVRAVPARPSFPSRDFESGRRSAPASGDESGMPSRPRSSITLGCAPADGRAGDGPSAPFRPGPGTGRSVQRGQFGDPQPGVCRP